MYPFSLSGSSQVANHPSCPRTLHDSGQEGSIPFAPDGCKNHLLPLIMNRHVQEGGLLLVEDDVSVVAQKEGDSFGVALCCSKVKRSVLGEKIEHENPGTVAGHPLAILLLTFVELLKRTYEQN